MKKILLTLLVALTCSTSAFAQFEQGKYYASASATNLNMSFSDHSDFAFGIALNAGYMLEKDFMALAEFGTDYSNSDFREIYVGLKGRYYIEQNGLFLSAGVRLLHAYKSINDFQITPEVGYCYFLNKTVTIEPSVYYDLSLSDFGGRSEFGVKVGIGLYF